MTDAKARRIIAGLINAAHDGALVDFQDGGINIDIILSQVKGHTDEPMTVEESERRLDAAIRLAWYGMTGKRIPTDPVDFILSKPKRKAGK